MICAEDLTSREPRGFRVGHEITPEVFLFDLQVDSKATFYLLSVTTPSELYDGKIFGLEVLLDFDRSWIYKKG